MRRCSQACRGLLLSGTIVLTACASTSDQPAESAAAIAPPEYVELVRLANSDIANDDVMMHCSRVNWPGSRIIVGMRCEPATTTRNFAFNEWYFWETEIFAPGLYVMRRKR